MGSFVVSVLDSMSMVLEHRPNGDTEGGTEQTLLNHCGHWTGVSICFFSSAFLVREYLSLTAWGDLGGCVCVLGREGKRPGCPGCVVHVRGVLVTVHRSAIFGADQSFVLRYEEHKRRGRQMDTRCCCCCCSAMDEEVEKIRSQLESPLLSDAAHGCVLEQPVPARGDGGEEVQEQENQEWETVRPGSVMVIPGGRRR